MTKQEYIEHCRALFENPLIDLSSIYVKDEYTYTTRSFLKKDTFIGMAILDCSDEESLIYCSDFRQGGKYYKKEQ